MHVNNLGAARMPVTTTADRTTQTSQTRFSTLMQGATNVPTTTGQAGVPGSTIVASTIAANSGGLPGSGFGAPYLQSGNAAAAAGSEFNGELQSTHNEQMMLAVRELIQMSLMSFIQGSFAIGQMRPKPEAT